jgi:hypothetical protein
MLPTASPMMETADCFPDPLATFSRKYTSPHSQEVEPESPVENVKTGNGFIFNHDKHMRDIKPMKRQPNQSGTD